MKIEWFETKNGGSAGQIVQSAKLMLAGAVAIFVCAALITLSGCRRNYDGAGMAGDSNFAKLTPEVYEKIAYLAGGIGDWGSQIQAVQQSIQKNAGPGNEIGTKIAVGKYRLDNSYVYASKRQSATIKSGELLTSFHNKSEANTDDWDQVDIVTNKMDNLIFYFPPIPARGFEGNNIEFTFNGELRYTDVMLENAPELSFKGLSASMSEDGKTYSISFNDGKFQVLNKVMRSLGSPWFQIAENSEISGTITVDGTNFQFFVKKLAERNASFRIISGTEEIAFTKSM